MKRYKVISVVVLLLLAVGVAFVGCASKPDQSAMKIERPQAHQTRDAAERERERLREEQHERRETVADLIEQSQRLTDDRRYSESKVVLDQILALDPNNEYARGVRPQVEAEQDSVLIPTDGTDAGRIAGPAVADQGIAPATQPAVGQNGGSGAGGGPGFGLQGQRRLLQLRDAARKEGTGAARNAAVDELWVIEKSPEPAALADEKGPGTGALMAKRGDGQEMVAVPLKHTDVKAAIAGYIGTVDVTQQYHNPYDAKIEAVYVFPLPHNAAVNEFVMTIGERKIRGIIREKEEAKRIYQEAKSQGHVASLLTQERPNIFTQSVANIEPGKAIDINIKYFHTLAYVDGWYEWVFPMVVGPRFNPPGSTDGVGAVPRGGQGMSGQATEVQYLRPSERSGHDISVAVTIDAGVGIEEIACKSHQIDVAKNVDNVASVNLQKSDTIPNKDFVLRYKVAGDRVKSALMAQRDERGGHFTLMLYPPESMRDLQRKPIEMVFVLDCSGSMSGKPMEQSKDAMRSALQMMRPDDTFQVIRFSENASALGGAPIPATPENIKKGLLYVEQLNGEGGTMMIEGIKAALDFPHTPGRLRFVASLTDGFIGNEEQILGEINKRLGPSRIFSFGVGSSVNRYLLDHMAKMGNGAVAYLGLNENGGEVMSAFFERISHPAMTDLAIDWGNLQVEEVYPSRVPDLFVGRPVILTGRFKGDGQTTVKVTGEMAGERSTLDIPVDPSQAVHSGIAPVWARAKIADLGDRATYVDDVELPDQIKHVALSYGLMSPYTAFTAVDATAVTAGSVGTTVAVPVPVPDGVKYETTVPE